MKMTQTVIIHAHSKLNFAYVFLNALYFTHKDGFRNPVVIEGIILRIIIDLSDGYVSTAHTVIIAHFIKS